MAKEIDLTGPDSKGFAENNPDHESVIAANKIKKEKMSPSKRSPSKRTPAKKTPIKSKTTPKKKAASGSTGKKMKANGGKK